MNLHTIKLAALSVALVAASWISVQAAEAVLQVDPITGACLDTQEAALGLYAAQREGMPAELAQAVYVDLAGPDPYQRFILDIWAKAVYQGMAEDLSERDAWALYLGTCIQFIGSGARELEKPRGPLSLEGEVRHG